MAGKNAFDTVNRVLELRGQLPISSTNNFNSRTGLSKLQNQALLFVDLANRLFAFTFNKRFNQRVFTLTTNATDTEYDLDGAITVEGLKFHSIRNVTDSGLYNQRLPLMNFLDWESRYPNPEQYARQMPQFFVPKEADGSTPDKVIIWPYADQAYTIQYQARLDTVEITSASQSLIWPIRYEHILWLKAAQFLEESMNEGRAPDMEKLVMEAVTDVLRDADGAVEDQAFVDLGITAYGDFDDWGPRRDFLPSDVQ